MSSYDDTNKISALHQEQAQVSQAVAVLDAGGTVTSFIVSPPSATQPGEMPSSMMAVGVNTVNPSPELLQQARTALVLRFDAINAELAALGVTDTPTTPEEAVSRSQTSRGRW